MYYIVLPVTVAAQSNALSFFTHSKPEFMGSNPTEGIDVCLHLYSVCDNLCVHRCLAKSSCPPSSKESYSVRIGLRNQKVVKAQQEGCRAIIIIVVVVVVVIVVVVVAAAAAAAAADVIIVSRNSHCSVLVPPINTVLLLGVPMLPIWWVKIPTYLYVEPFLLIAFMLLILEKSLSSSSSSSIPLCYNFRYNSDLYYYYYYYY
jgi:hypothetical protein